MTKAINIILLLSVHTIVWCQEFDEGEIIELPIELKAGYLPFLPNYNTISLKDHISGSPWEKIKVEVTGIPEDWEDPVLQQIWFDPFQLAYQNYMQGNFNASFFNVLAKQWNLDVERYELSDTPIKCFSHIVLTRLETGEVLYKVDTNNDRDFSDEKVFKPIKQSGSLRVADSLSKHAAHLLDAEIYMNGHVKQVQFPLFITKSFNGRISKSFPQYAQTYFLEKLLLSSSDFTDPTFRGTSDIMVLDTANLNASVETIELYEFLEIEGQKFQNLGVDFGSQTLKLKRVPQSTVNSTQVGYAAIPFGGREFTTGDSIRLDDFRGKFLFVKFWGTWCGPCVHEMPNLKDIYEKLNKDNIEFLGIARDNPESLTGFIKEVGIPWPQLLSDKQNNIVDLYHIDRFPSSFLINRQGKIIAKDLTGKNLLETLRGYMNMSGK